jgi:hypothetical protein
MNDEYAHVCEHTLHRLVAVVDGPRLLPHAFTYIPAMLANYDWRLRHAGLAAVAGVLVRDYSLAVGLITHSLIHWWAGKSDAIRRLPLRTLGK